LVVFGTRVPVNTILGNKRSGKTVEQIANDYSLDPEVVEKALIHIGVGQKAA
jgi:uncharacterized protein (DUF433 family)